MSTFANFIYKPNSNLLSQSSKQNKSSQRFKQTKCNEPIPERSVRHPSDVSFKGAPRGVRYDLNPDYFNENGKIRLSRVRFLNQHEKIDIPELNNIFEAWVNYDEGLILQEQNLKTFEKKTIGVKASKRGNDVYRWRIKNRLKEIEELADLQDIIFFSPFVDGVSEEVNPKTPCLFITFTYDTKRCTRHAAWENIGIEFNRAVSWLKKRYGEVSIFRAWEAFENGYPHIHALVYFREAKFHVFYDGTEYRVDEAKTRGKKGQKHYRVGLDQSWHSFIDVSAVQSFAKSAHYLTKYLSKVHNRKETKHRTTLSNMWLYRKRGFAISGSFAKDLKAFRLDNLMHNSNQKNRLIQQTLTGLPLKPFKKWVLVGFAPWIDVLEVAKPNPYEKNKDLWQYELYKIPSSCNRKNDFVKNWSR
jgi:hypothetical protein